jgi:hypothetical protein
METAHQNNPARESGLGKAKKIEGAMESTPLREDPLPSYLENTKSTAYRWQQDITDSTAHPSIGDNTTREHDPPKGAPYSSMLANNKTTNQPELVV